MRENEKEKYYSGGRKIKQQDLKTRENKIDIAFKFKFKKWKITFKSG